MCGVSGTEINYSITNLKVRYKEEGLKLYSSSDVAARVVCMVADGPAAKQNKGGTNWEGTEWGSKATTRAGLPWQLKVTSAGSGRQLPKP